MSDILVLQNVCKSFGSRPVVKNVSFSVKEGEIFGFRKIAMEEYGCQ